MGIILSVSSPTALYAWVKKYGPDGSNPLKQKKHHQNKPLTVVFLCLQFADDKNSIRVAFLSLSSTFPFHECVLHGILK